MIMVQTRDVICQKELITDLLESYDAAGVQGLPVLDPGEVQIVNVTLGLLSILDVDLVKQQISIDALIRLVRRSRRDSMTYHA